ncbi:radical SAM/SPASM domain-containing protein [Paraclostridium bifermentans]|uniref:radical SAM/SPASM domain-containing protein n=1 Tax=Paraclostridium bifermentans TaxID=1490 RepID=UPI00189AECD3|nr:radical SAM protein [Paraclostridium bifermentans]
MYINSNNVISEIKGINMLINTKNGVVIGLDQKCLDFYSDLENIENEGIVIEDKEIKEFFDFLVANELISFNPFSIKKQQILSAYVHVTNKCNLHCVGCYSLDSKRNNYTDLTFDQMCKAIKDLADVGLTTLVFSGGEPFIRKDIVKLVKFAKLDCNINHVVLITNGTIVRDDLDELAKYIDVVSVSIDTYDTKCSNFLRDEGIHSKIINTIEDLKKSGINVSLLPTLHSLNASKMENYIELSKSMKIGISFSILTTCETLEFKKFMLNQEDLRGISNHFLEYDFPMCENSQNIGLQGTDYCGAGQIMLSIGTDGEVYPCHMLMSNEFSMGNIKVDSIRNMLEVSNVAREFSTLNVNQFENCKSCEYKHFCGGGCRARASMLAKNIKAKDPYCILYKNYYSGLINELVCRVEESLEV